MLFELKFASFVLVHFRFEVSPAKVVWAQRGEVRWPGWPGDVTKTWDEASRKHGYHTVLWLTCCVCCGTVLLKSELTIDVVGMQVWRLQHCSVSCRGYGHCTVAYFKEMRLNNSKRRHSTPNCDWLAALWTHCVVAHGSSIGSFVKMGSWRHNRSVPGRPLRRRFFFLNKRRTLSGILLQTFFCLFLTFKQIHQNSDLKIVTFCCPTRYKTKLS
jgi:hypothetical protein